MDDSNRSRAEGSLDQKRFPEFRRRDSQVADGIGHLADPHLTAYFNSIETISYGTEPTFWNECVLPRAGEYAARPVSWSSS